jgi:integrase
MAAGIRQRHRKGCSQKGKCSCSWQAWVYDAEAGEKIRRTFPSYAAARSWRHDSYVALKQGKLRAAGGATLSEVVEAWLDQAEEGTIRARGGHLYKPATLRGYERALRLRVLPVLGSRRLGELTRLDVQALVDELVGKGWKAATVSMTIGALQAVCHYELRRGRLSVNPADHLELPAIANNREHVVSPEHAAQLVAVLPERDKALWGTAMYGGLRRGELRALRASDADLSAGVLRVERSWDDKEGVGETKGRNKRLVPIPSVLARLLREHLLRTGRRGEQLLFGPSGVSPFSPRPVATRADRAWRAAGLERIVLHECRHTYASFMIAAGVNAKALSTFMGHSTINITLDRYGHLLPGSESEAAGLLDTYLSGQAVSR